ncbi:MAG TPA: protein-L-isoaspartate O-methyltransferase, partial [Alphaproteobacteria bacterium]|nr:protein-L-isoaspartate O-methyltransferase [Alphaproteobacteria bacterium]
SPVGIFPCEGARDEESERALAAAFEQRSGLEGKVKRLVRGDDVPESDCWVKAPGWALTYR